MPLSGHGRSGTSHQVRRERGVRRALTEFLALPFAMMAGMCLLALVSAYCDRASWSWLQHGRDVVAVVLPSQQNQTMLTTVAPGMLTVMSITFFLFLTLVQRMGGSFTWMVIEQFFLNRANRLFFGYYSGVSAYLVVVLALEGPPQALYSTLVALILTVVALAGLLIFGYLVLDQLRPPAVVQRIVGLTMVSRARQVSVGRRLRTETALPDVPAETVRAGDGGYVVGIDFDGLGAAVRAVGPRAEVEFVIVLGKHLTRSTPVAVVRAEHPAERDRLAAAVLKSVLVGRERKVVDDAVHGVHQLSSIAWAAIEQPDPEAAMVAVAGLHTLLAEWMHADGLAGDEDGSGADGDGAKGDATAKLPVVYVDNTVEELVSSVISTIVVSNSNRQHQTCAAVLGVLAAVLPQLTANHADAAVDQLHRVLPSVHEHDYVLDLERELRGLRETLVDMGRDELAGSVAFADQRSGDRR